MSSTSKWGYLKEFYTEQIALARLQGLELTITQVAQLAKRHFPNLELDVESIRKRMSGELNRSTVNTTTTQSPGELVRQSHKFAGVSQQNIYVKPTSFKDPGTYLALGCVHVPGHNVAMINGITKLIGDLPKLKGLMLLGDFLDCNSLSSHDKGKFTAIKGLTLTDEYEAGNLVLDQLTECLPSDAHKVFLYGNHCDRWNRYMSDMEDAKRPLLSPQQALELDKRGFHTYTNWKSDYVTLGNHLDLMHGQYYSTHSAKKHIDVYRGSVMYVHTHRVQTYIEGKTGGWNIGWGGDINSPLFNYMERGTKSQWLNGFALITIDENGDHYVEQVICHNNKFYVGGKKYN